MEITVSMAQRKVPCQGKSQSTFPDPPTGIVPDRQGLWKASILAYGTRGAAGVARATPSITSSRPGNRITGFELCQ